MTKQAGIIFGPLTLIATVVAIWFLLPISIDNKIHVSADRRLAVVRHHEKYVTIFRDDQKKGLSDNSWFDPREKK